MDNLNVNGPGMNLRSRNLIICLPNPPGWTAYDPRAPHLIYELTRSGFFQQEVDRANIGRLRKIFTKATRIIPSVAMGGLICGITYFYYQHCQEIIKAFYITNDLA